METITIHPKTHEQLLALKALATAMQVDFETGESPYDPEFVVKVLESEKERKAGKKGLRVDVNNIWK